MALFRKNRGGDAQEPKEQPAAPQSTPPAPPSPPSPPDLTPTEPAPDGPAPVAEVTSSEVTPEVISPVDSPSLPSSTPGAGLAPADEVTEVVTVPPVSEPDLPVAVVAEELTDVEITREPGRPTQDVAEVIEVSVEHEQEAETEDEADAEPSAPVGRVDRRKGDKVLPVQTTRPRPVRELPRVMAVANQKGGVGKTTTTINLGAALAELGYRVLVVDLDPQGNATTGLGIERRNFEHSMYDVIMREHPLEDCIESTSVKNLFVAPATLDLSGVDIELVPAFNRESRLKRAIEPILDDFDFVMIDCPPSLGLITINALTAAREVLVPIQCEYYALEGLTQLRSTLQLVGSNLNQELEMSTIVLTMFDSRTNLSTDVANDVRQHFPDQVCDTIIPRTVRLSEAPSFGQPITVFDTRSTGAEAYRNLAKEVANGAPKRAG